MQHDRQLPLAAPRHPGNRRKGSRGWVGRAVVAAILLLAFVFVPIPAFFMELPGPVRDVERLVEVSHARTFSSEGTLYMTTVSLDVNVTGLDMLAAAVDPTKQLVSRTAITRGSSLERLEQVQRRMMAESKQQARAVALSALGLGEPSGDGVLVTDTVGGSPADGVLEPGDVIRAIDGRPVETACDVGAALDRTVVGDAVELGLRRHGEQVKVRVQTAATPRTTGSFLGVKMRNVGYHLDSPVEVDFKTGRIAGPSAGLMFTLALYDRLTPDDLTGGRTIAGTGAIGCEGVVAPIGGVAQKVVAAERSGAEVFLAPADNFDEARSAAEGVDVVAVADFQDALAYLQGSSR